MAGEKELTAEQKKKDLAELMWLNYFNQTLYEKGLITEAEQLKAIVTKEKEQQSPGIGE